MDPGDENSSHFDHNNINEIVEEILMKKVKGTSELIPVGGDTNRG
jgi:hypothetical protein